MKSVKLPIEMIADFSNSTVEEVNEYIKLIEKEEHKAIYKMLTTSIKKTHGVRSTRIKSHKKEN